MAMTTGPKWCRMLDWLWYQPPRMKRTGRLVVSLAAQRAPNQVSLSPALFLRSGSVPTVPPFAFLQTTLSAQLRSGGGGSLPSFPHSHPQAQSSGGGGRRMADGGGWRLGVRFLLRAGGEGCRYLALLSSQVLPRVEEQSPKLRQSVGSQAGSGEGP